jgi:hypothetical protein
MQTVSKLVDRVTGLGRGRIQEVQQNSRRRRIYTDSRITAVGLSPSVSGSASLCSIAKFSFSSLASFLAFLACRFRNRLARALRIVVNKDVQ